MITSGLEDTPLIYIVSAPHEFQNVSYRAALYIIKFIKRTQTIKNVNHASTVSQVQSLFSRFQRRNLKFYNSTYMTVSELERLLSRQLKNVLSTCRILRGIIPVTFSIYEATVYSSPFKNRNLPPLNKIASLLHDSPGRILIHPQNQITTAAVSPSTLYSHMELSCQIEHK